jgi:methylenetetrahydrofolate reductase (NADPH)
MNNQASSERTFSFELFPPKTPEGMEKLAANVQRLNAVDPLYFSVTYGAGGSTRDRTFETVSLLRGQGIDTAPHLSCIGSSREEIRDILRHYQGQDIHRIVALRGDLPSGMGAGAAGELRYANDLVAFIREETGDHFHIEVAAYPEYHPQAPTAEQDLANFKRKVDAGADAAITQYFYNADAYFAFLDRCAKLAIHIPIVPGVMPITNYSMLARFSDACGAEIPRWVRKRLEGYGDDIESIRAFGHEVVLAMCRRLLEGGAPGIHFYTMNQAAPVLRLWKELRLPRAERIATPGA